MDQEIVPLHDVAIGCRRSKSLETLVQSRTRHTSGAANDALKCRQMMKDSDVTCEVTTLREREGEWTTVLVHRDAVHVDSFCEEYCPPVSPVNLLSSALDSKKDRRCSSDRK